LDLVADEEPEDGQHDRADYQLHDPPEVLVDLILPDLDVLEPRVEDEDVAFRRRVIPEVDDVGQHARELALRHHELADVAEVLFAPFDLDAVRLEE
jgi:hypothetical protein